MNSGELSSCPDQKSAHPEHQRSFLYGHQRDDPWRYWAPALSEFASELRDACERKTAARAVTHLVEMRAREAVAKRRAKLEEGKARGALEAACVDWICIL